MPDIRPLKPIDKLMPSMRDHAKAGFSLGALEALVDSWRGQTDWRMRADRAHAFYDMGKQLTPAIEQKIRREWGIEPRQTNLIHGVINGVLGQEAKARSDVKLEADQDEFVDVSDALSARLKEAQREANIDMAVSNAYASQVKGGIGWVEVSKASDPLDYQYRITDIHRNEIAYDMASRSDIGLMQARWQIRKRWQDLDEAIALMPEHETILRGATNGWDAFNMPTDGNMYSRYQVARENERATIMPREEWMDSRRKRIKFYEVWYRVPAEVVVLQIGPGRKVVYDKTNPLHVEAVSRGLTKLTKTVTRQIRMALFAGPHRLIDVATTRRRFPYIPFFAFRDDEDNSPYGMIEGMISPQEEFNERRQLFNWMLLARQVQIDDDALNQSMNTIKDIEGSIMRPDLMVVMNANRRNANGFKIGNDLQFQREQFEAMQDAKQLIQDVPKVYGTQLGNAAAGVTSGIANSLLIEQGLTTMGELNDNYRFGRKAVYEAVLDLIVEDHLEEDMQINIGNGSARRTIVLNSWDPQTGAPVNRVKDAPVSVGLSDVPNSPAFRMQEQQQLSQIITSLQGNPAAMNILAPAYIESSSLSGRKQIANALRRATGQPVEGDKQAQQEAEQMAKQLAQTNMQLDQAAKQAEIEKTTAEARLANSRAESLDDGSHLEMRRQSLLEMQPEVPPAANNDQLIQDAIREASGGA